MAISRKVDELGRVTIPVEYRRLLGIDINSHVDVHLIDGDLVIRKQGIYCKVCYSNHQEELNYVRAKNIYICDECLAEVLKEV